MRLLAFMIPIAFLIGGLKTQPSYKQTGELKEISNEDPPQEIIEPLLPPSDYERLAPNFFLFMDWFMDWLYF